MIYAKQNRLVLVSDGCVCTYDYIYSIDISLSLLRCYYIIVSYQAVFAAEQSFVDDTSDY